MLCSFISPSCSTWLNALLNVSTENREVTTSHDSAVFSFSEFTYASRLLIGVLAAASFVTLWVEYVDIPSTGDVAIAPFYIHPGFVGKSLKEHFSHFCSILFRRILDRESTCRVKNKKFNHGL